MQFGGNVVFETIISLKAACSKRLSAYLRTDVRTTNHHSHFEHSLIPQPGGWLYEILEMTANHVRRIEVTSEALIIPRLQLSHVLDDRLTHVSHMCTDQISRSLFVFGSTCG